MLVSIEIPDGVPIIIESDNCKSQYKSAQHFFNMQNIANKYMRLLIYLYGVAGHGKGEVDHVGGMAKAAVPQEIARGAYFSNAEEIVSFLTHKFGVKEVPRYVIQEMLSEDVDILRQSTSRLAFKTVSGSDSFHVLVFTPGASTFKAANWYCICSICQIEYGSCSLFTDYDLNVETIHPSVLRSQKLYPVTEEQDDTEAMDFITPECIVAVAAPEKDIDTVWFIKVPETGCQNTEPVSDDYNHVIPAGMLYMAGNFLERMSSSKSGTLFKLSKKVTFFYNETVVFPYVEMEEGKRSLILQNKQYMDTILHLEETGFAHL